MKDLNVTRDDIRSFTAGVVKEIDQKVSTRLEQDHVVIRVDITGEVEPRNVVHAIAALRENDQARQELLALRAETDRLQAQVDDTNRALAAASTPSEVQQYTDQRQDMLDQMQANALLSQAWTSWTYPTLGFYSYPWFGVSGINGLLLQAQRLSPYHRHLPLAQRMITANNSTSPAQPPVSAPPHPRYSFRRCRMCINIRPRRSSTAMASRPRWATWWSSRHPGRFPRLRNTPLKRRPTRSTPTISGGPAPEHSELPVGTAAPTIGQHGAPLIRRAYRA